MSDSIMLQASPLTAKSFAPFGEVIETEFAKTISINDGLATRFHQLATAELSGEGGAVAVSLFRSDPLSLPHRVKVMERHPLGSQAFYPLSVVPFLILVARNNSNNEPEEFSLFLTNGNQGVNFFRNIWHHFLIVRQETCDFLVVDRVGAGDNLEEAVVEQEVIIPMV